jgi:hypothetical protein
MKVKNEVLKQVLTKIKNLDLLDAFVIRIIKFAYITTIQTAIFSSEFTTDSKVRLFHLLNEFESITEETSTTIVEDETKKRAEQDRRYKIFSAAGKLITDGFDDYINRHRV